MRMAYMILWAGLGVTSRAWASSAAAQEWSAMRVASVDSISPVRAKETIRVELEYVRAPVENPLKGLVPYTGEHGDRFPHTLEFNYLPLSDLVLGEETYDWTPLEALLDDVSGRGHQTVFRVYLEYPGKKKGIPEYLVKRGLKVHRYTNTNTQPFPSTESATPDYSNQDLRRCLRNFITELGRRYDGDRRIGFITAGLLGTWGEWHTYPRNDLWAGKEVQSEVLDAYEAAFKVTPILLRYPAGEGHYAQAPNAGRRFGYHDDSFAWATLDTGKKGDEWFFLALMKAAGPAAIDKWKQYPIGGEIRPEAWGKVFDEKPDERHIQDIGQCVKETHATWLMDSGIFQEKTWTEARRRRAEEVVQQMGYEFHVPSVTWTWKGLSLIVEVEIENRGVAPFYYDWPVEFALLSTKGSMVRRVSGKGKLTGILPGERPRVWKESLDLGVIVPDSYQLALRVPNPMPNGIPLRFANQTQDQHAPGWLTLASVAWRLGILEEQR